jgi:hypothetical protein
MEVVNEFIIVLALTVIGGCIGFVIFILKHEKEHKKEMHEKNLCEAESDKNGIG